MRVVKTRSRSGVPAPSSDEAHNRMVANRSRDTRPERELRSELHRLGLRFRVHRRVLPEVRRQVDVAFGPTRVAVFVDGCFWHGCPEHGTQAKANASFWREKIETNQSRDANTDERLRAAGWLVVRIWEHEDAKLAARRVARVVRLRTTRSR